MRRTLISIGLSAMLGATAPAFAQVAPKPPAVAAAELSLPLAEAGSLLLQAQADIRAGKIADFAPLVPALERALANPDTPKTIGDAPVFLIDGIADRLLVQMWLTTPEGKDAAARGPRLISDPYPHIAYALGFYYNEIKQPDQALRAFKAGVEALKKHMDPNLTDSATLLQAEIGASYNIAKRWQEAHDTFKAALDLPDKGLRPQMYRGMGFSLIEMNRLDEAAAAYEQSLKLDPNNASAKNELAYIAQLRNGGPKQAPTVFVAPTSPSP